VSPKRETSLPLPVRFLAAWIGVWLGRSQQQLIEYQREEIQLLRQKLGGLDTGTTIIGFFGVA
jgi:hypothetical protein